MKKLYAVIDLETTGGKASRDRITEIGIVLHDGNKVLDQWESLINPETYIPWGITELTGISQAMVADAPKFFEVAKKIVEMTEGAIFVAHNARFDYSFLCEEFRRLGYTYTRKQLCTLRLARQALPELHSHGLDAMSHFLGIENKNRHRALGDALATAELLAYLFSREDNQLKADLMINLGIKESLLPQNLDLEKIHALPEACGVYYFHDVTGEVIYVGKSINIQKRVAEHFADKTEKAKKLQEGVNDISYELTGSELVALIHESMEIKRLRPRINRAQRQRNFPYVIHTWKNEGGYRCFGMAETTASTRKNLQILAEFPKANHAKGKLNAARQQFGLCEKLVGLGTRGGACFQYHLQNCQGACIEKESAESYNERADQALEALTNLFETNFFLIDEGRTLTEQAVVLVEDGRYQGHGYVEVDADFASLELLREAVKTYQGNPELNKIIHRHILSDSNLRIIEF